MAEDGDENEPIMRRPRRYRQRSREIPRDALRRAAELGEISDEGLDEPTDLLFGMVLGLNIAVGVGPARARSTVSSSASDVRRPSGSTRRS